MQPYSSGLLAALLLTGVASGATTQDTLPAEPAAGPAPCELHVWPAAGLSLARHRAHDNLETGYMGPILGTTGQGRIERNTARVGTRGPETGSPLDPEIQLQVLREADLPALLGLPGHHAVFHEVALDKTTLRTVQGRYDSAAAAPCYADLVLSDVVYSREYANGQNLKAFIRFRDFGTGETIERRYATWIQTDLEYDREKPTASEQEMDAELVAGLASNLRKFGDLLRTRK